MTREEAKQFLIDSGVAEPTDEAVSNLLNTIQKQTKAAEDKASRYKEDSLRVKELTKELDELKSANLTDLEKANKATEQAMERVAELEKTVKTMELSKSLAEIGIIGDDASQLVNEDGSLNTSKLGEILKAREEGAVSSYKEKILDETPSPSGGKGDDEVKPEVAYAKEYVARNSANNAQSIIDSYK